MDQLADIGDTSSLLEALGEGFQEASVGVACPLKEDLRAVSSRVVHSSSGSAVGPRAHRAGVTWQVAIAVLMGGLLSDATHASEPQDTAMVAISAGTFDSVLPPSDKIKRVAVRPFRLDITPVTNGQFARFLRKNPQWQRDQVAWLFADEQYLRHWSSSTRPAQGSANQPVVHVSWFAASAYCESRGARLPTWHEWEYVAAANESTRDARSDAQWRQQILSWYSQSGRGELPAVGLTPANVYGARDIHGVVWEWIEDLPSLLVADDSREQGDPNQMRFCGAGAVAMEGKENYAMLMRIAMLSSMKANYTSATMGFRCATDGASNP